MIRYQNLRSLGPPFNRRPIALLSQTPPHRSPWLGVRPTRARRHATSVTVQRVRFKNPPFFTRRRFISWIAYTLPVVALLWWSPVGIEWVEDEEADAEEQAAEEQEDELDPDRVSFIPMGWPKKTPPEYYKGTDPEWQAFKAFAQDTKRPITVQKQIIGESRTAVSRNPSVVQRIGKVDGKLGRALLTIVFPAGPPRLYEVSGIALTDTEIAWATKVMSQAEYLRLRNAVYPTAAFEGIKNSSRYLFFKQWNAMKRTFDFADSDPFPTNASHDSQHQRQGEQKGKTSGDGESPKIGPLPPVQAEANKRSTREPPPEVSNGSASTSKNSTKLPFWFPFPVSTSAEAKASIAGQEPKRRKPDAWNEFGKGFMKEYSKVVNVFEVPRGNIFVTGMVEVVGSKGRLTMDVFAAYDLTTGRVTEFKGYQRSFTPYRQPPLGS